MEGERGEEKGRRRRGLVQLCVTDNVRRGSDGVVRGWTPFFENRTHTHYDRVSSRVRTY